MKDKDARIEKDKNARIENIEDRLKSHGDMIQELIDKLGNLTIKECEKCKHETVHLKKIDYTSNSCNSTFTSINPCSFAYGVEYLLCTVCGLTTRCVTETVCKPYTVGEK